MHTDGSRGSIEERGVRSVLQVAGPPGRMGCQAVVQDGTKRSPAGSLPRAAPLVGGRFGRRRRRRRRRSGRRIGAGLISVCRRHERRGRLSGNGLSGMDRGRSYPCARTAPPYGRWPAIGTVTGMKRAGARTMRSRHGHRGGLDSRDGAWHRGVQRHRCQRNRPRPVLPLVAGRGRLACRPRQVVGPRQRQRTRKWIRPCQNSQVAPPCTGMPPPPHRVAADCLSAWRRPCPRTC